MNLHEYISKKKDLTSNHEFQDWCTNELLCGLNYLHKNGIIVRDIKPQNILVRGEWPSTLEIKYCDFGGSRGKGIALKDGSFTHEVCTLWYRSPEILLGKKEYGSCLDVWSLSCVLYELCAGEPLFMGACEDNQVRKIMFNMGSPTKDEWPEFENLPDYKNQYSIYKKNDVLKGKNTSPKMAKVIYSGLTLNPEMRPSIKYLHDLFNF